MTVHSNKLTSAAVPAQACDHLAERAAICDVLQNWGLWRDRCNWDALRSVYAPVAIMQTTWMDGPASDFVDVCQRMSSGPTRAQHYIGVPIVQLNGVCALAQSRITILVRTQLNGIEVDATCYGWFIDRMVKLDGKWLILHRAPIYEKDTLAAVDPDLKLNLDAEVLAGYPAHYKFMAYMQSIIGAPINLALPMPNSKEQEQLLQQGEAWLAAGTP